MSPLISIIVPVYNAERFLPHCIESILSQSYQNFELYLIDDGSTDSSAEICDKFSLTDNRIKVTHQSNSGQSIARNTALDLVQGEYIAFVDSDDYISPLFLEKLLDRIEKDNSDIVVCNYCAIDEQGNTWIPSIERHGLLSSDEFWLLEKKHKMYCVALWNKLFKSSLWKTLRLKEGKYAEDSFAMTQYICKAQSISIIEDVLYYYFQRRDSLVHAFSIKNLDSVEAKFERIQLLKDSRYTELKKSILYSAFCMLSRAYNHLDMQNEKNKERYKELREEYKRWYKILYRNDLKVSWKRAKCLSYLYSDRLFSAVARTKHFWTKKKH